MNLKIEDDTALRVIVEARSVIFMRLLLITRPSRCNLSRLGKTLGDLRLFFLAILVVSIDHNGLVSPGLLWVFSGLDGRI